MILHDYLPSQNAWKVRQLLAHLDRPYQTREVAIFAGAGQSPDFLARNPAGAVPVLELDDGRCLAESNAILAYLAEGTPYLPADPWQRAQVLRWLCFEADYVQGNIATLRHWVQTGKDARRDPALVAAKRAGSARVLGMLERHLAGREFLVECGYSIADLAVYAYAHRADEAGVDLAPFPRFRAWCDRVRAQPGFGVTVHPYSIDPESWRELP